MSKGIFINNKKLNWLQAKVYGLSKEVMEKCIWINPLKILFPMALLMFLYQFINENYMREW